MDNYSDYARDLSMECLLRGFYLKPPTLSEKKPIVDCFLGDL